MLKTTRYNSETHDLTNFPGWIDHFLFNSVSINAYYLLREACELSFTIFALTENVSTCSFQKIL